jgi:micrococcal nuclease
MKKRGLIIIGAVLLIAIAIAAHQLGWVKPVDPATFMKYEPGSYTVKTFLDGDTVIVDMGGVDETIRFIGVDTPETHKPNTPVECYGPLAAAYTKKRIGSSRIRLVADRLTTNRDRYNRLLRYVVLDDGTYLNKELVEKGYGFAYSFPFAELRAYADAMEQSRQNKRGLWDSCQPVQDPSTGQWHSNTATDPVVGI